MNKNIVSHTDVDHKYSAVLPRCDLMVKAMMSSLANLIIFANSKW